jgi:hypothetical protein
MTQEPKKLINLSVHETSDPSLISPNPDKEASGEELNDLNDSVHDDENVDVANPGLDAERGENLGERQIGIANLSAGQAYCYFLTQVIGSILANQGTPVTFSL